MTQTSTKNKHKKEKKEKKQKADLENFLAPAKEVAVTVEEEVEDLKPFIPTERTSKIKATTIQGVNMSPTNAKHYAAMLEEAYIHMQRLYATAGKMSANKRRYLQDLYDKLQDAHDVASQTK
jgi:hypothetical protein